VVVAYFLGHPVYGEQQLACHKNDAITILQYTGYVCLKLNENACQCKYNVLDGRIKFILGR